MTRPKVPDGKRRRTARACDTCRLRKQKCDGKDLSGNCNHGIESPQTLNGVVDVAATLTPLPQPAQMPPNMATHLEGQPPASSALHDGMLYHRVNSGPTAIAPIDDFGFQEGDRCKDERCQYIQFFTHTILLLHERQIHAHGEKTYLCTYDERQYYFIAQPLPAAGLLQLTRGLENDLFIFKDGYVLKSKVTGIFIESVDWNENEIRKFWKDELAPLGSIADPAKVEEVCRAHQTWFAV